MAYAVWFVLLVLLLVLAKQYLRSRANHAAAANAVFAKHTFALLTSDQKDAVRQKAKELAATDRISEIECYGWYALAMHELAIPSAIPENPCWYPKVRPDKIYPSNLLVNSVISFIEKRYSISIEFGAETPAQVSANESENKVSELKG